MLPPDTCPDEGIVKRRVTKITAAGVDKRSQSRDARALVVLAGYVACE
jgi:hypothetical protein